MKTSFIVLASSLILANIAPAQAMTRVQHQYACATNGDNAQLVVNLDNNDEILSINGTKATFDGSYTSRSGDGMQRFAPEQSLSDEAATEILVQPTLLDGAPFGRLVIYYRGEIFESVAYTCRLSK